MGIDLEALRDDGKLFIEQMDAAEVSPGEFAHKVRSCVETEAIRTVIIDSLNGYQNAMPEEQFLILHMHELLQYLNRLGAATFLTVAQHGLVGDMKSPVDVTYLADTVLLLRYFEAFGEVRRAISVLKKRTGRHENTIREFSIDNTGLKVGAPLDKFQGVLRGVPQYLGGQTDPKLEYRNTTHYRNARLSLRRKVETHLLHPVFWVKRGLSLKYAMTCQSYCGS